jgi:hypothetical protein
MRWSEFIAMVYASGIGTLVALDQWPTAICWICAFILGKLHERNS